MQPRWRFLQLAWTSRIFWLAMHTLSVGLLLVFDSDLCRQTEAFSWYAAAYYFLLLVTVVQYFRTAGSAPGYVVDVMEQDKNFEANFKSSLDGNNSAPRTLSSASTSQLAVDLNGSSESVHINISEKTPLLGSSSSVLQPVIPGICDRKALYSQPSFPSESSNWRCPYCRIWQPLRTKHCHDCDKCVMRFDHHCVWLGTCIGQSNHRKFWWFVFWETILCFWTTVLYFSAFSKDENWLLHDILVLAVLTALLATLAFLVTLLIFHSYLVVTNQTTYEKTRRRRITYLKSYPDSVYPFSNGVTSNVSTFCCSPSDTYPIYSLPNMADVQAQLRSRKWWEFDYVCCH